MAVVHYHDLDRAVIDGHAEGMCKLIALKANGEILGVHVVGEQALEVVEIAAAGMAAGMHVSQLAELEIAYPTFTAIVGLAARQICHDLGFDVPSARWGALSSRLPAGWELSHDH
jgi:dihydrolipoamide dehydrogenase